MNFQKPNNNYVADSRPEYVVPLLTFFISFPLLYWSREFNFNILIFPESHRWASFVRLMKFGINEPSNSMQSRMKVSYIQCHITQIHKVNTECCHPFCFSLSPIHSRLYWTSLTLFSSADETMLDTSNLLVTASHSIFQKEDNKEAPVAVVGYQFQHSALHGLFKNITTNVSKHTKTSCNLFN